ncbi:tRNA (adenosine(37)-N6)-dimethylallyltransferase MiaA [Actinotalea sp. M2MS4P-6]|uniref:tRNA (adenosine(37)-N6)-dimethylallyltransferase MiaA n=1 Tax=Actinotalea sp. M2MS4P-6 TaxID=2983762 RepID=UPI0021E4AA8E|nr:tRNA (adenosine(37)-N6)-dimethylallyltransferase MiaA [Actinotalea sp. M2MS4P-6]MCV2393456.1 tRNA (adenosine(37)-N6)-dimethylallyltransferase MiaA [Actinotalea sp. M2MS4P-6]
MRIAVVGPTATGKSDLAVGLALALGGEIVNADAMQLYRGMDIGTAKLTAAERRGVPHHQLDVIEVDEDASVAAYQLHARSDLGAIEARGARAIAAGGSGLYLRALLDRMELAPTDPAVRARFEAEAAERGPGAMHDELARRDPVAAAAIARTNTRRIVRALEVLELTGSGPRTALPAPEYEVPAVQIGLDCARPVLDVRIEARVQRMWSLGLVDEVAALASRMGRTAARAVGYAQVLALLRGETDEASAREATVIATRRLARRQMGWFGRDPRVHWLSADDPDLLARALDLVEAADAGRLPEPDGARRTLGS